MRKVISQRPGSGRISKSMANDTIATSSAKHKNDFPQLPTEIFIEILSYLTEVGDQVRFGKASMFMYQISTPGIYKSWSFDKYTHSGYSLWCFLRTAIQNPKLVASVTSLDLRELGISRDDVRVTERVPPETIEAWRKSYRDDLAIFERNGLIPRVSSYLRAWTDGLSEHSAIFRKGKGFSLVENHGFENFALTIIKYLMHHIPNVQTLYITQMKTPYELDSRLERPIRVGYMHNLRTLYYSRSRLDSLSSPSSTLLKFWSLPNLRSVYTSDILYVWKWRDRNEERRLDLDHELWDERKREILESEESHEGTTEVSSYSAVTDIAFDRASISVKHVCQIVSTVRKLVRFRWTHEFFGFIENEDRRSLMYRVDVTQDSRLSWANTGVLNLLSPHKGNLKELDLRFDNGTCYSADLPAPWRLNYNRSDNIVEVPYFLGSFADFHVLTSLTIDPVAVCGRSPGGPIRRNLVEMLPQSLEYLGLLYPFGHFDSQCECPQMIIRQTWKQEVLYFANSLPKSLPSLAEVELICTSKSWLQESGERDVTLEAAMRVFCSKGIACSISKITQLTPLPNFRTVPQMD